MGEDIRSEVRSHRISEVIVRLGLGDIRLVRTFTSPLCLALSRTRRIAPNV